jgi:signal transduction histidine kinase
VLIGTLCGAAYVAFDLVSEAKIGSGTLEGGLSRAHALIDHVVPFVVGGLLGVSAHYVRLRSQLTAAQEMAARAEALRFRLQKVERDQAVWVLVAAILHELKNPLHAIGLVLDEIADPELDDSRRSELIARARAQSDRALAALRRLRSMRTAEEPRFQAIELSQVLASLAADARVLAAEEGLDVSIECGRSVRANADPMFVRTIVENLVHNSLQSLRGRGGGRVRIALEREPGRAIVRVSDDGPPIDRDTAEAVFTPLVSTKLNGLGLGLPIARALARAMHGDLCLDQIDLKTFQLVLPSGEPT